jgi:cytochrome P450
MVGNIHQLPLSAFHLTVEEWQRRYGPIFRFDLGPKRVICVGDIDEIHAILRHRPEGFQRWREQRSIAKEMGLSGVSVAEGDDWRRQRRLVITALNTNHLQRYFSVVRKATERLRNNLIEAARSGRSIDVTWPLKSFSADVICALALGQDVNTMENPDNELLQNFERVSEMLGRRARAPVPYWRLIKLPSDRALERSVVALRTCALEFIEQARRRMAEDPGLVERPENLLQAMLGAQETEGRFTDDEVVGNALNVFHAGRDTTAYTLAWTLWFLTSRPDVQARARDEADEMLGDHLYAESYNAVERLQYAEAVVRESTRLEPVVINPFLVEPREDTVICGTHIPAGTHLFLLHRSASKTHESLTQPDDFEPDRWLSDDDGRPDARSLLSFGAGPRFCPGRNLALLEAKSALSMMVRNFDLELDESAGPVTELLIAMVTPQGLRLRFRERRVQHGARSRATVA